MLNVNTLLMAKDRLCSYAPIYFLLKYNWQYLGDLIFLYILKWSPLLVCYWSYYNITDCISSAIYGIFLYNCTCTSQAPLPIPPAPNSSPHCNQKSLCKLSAWQLCQASWGRHRAGGSQAILGLLWWDGWIRCRSRSDIGASMRHRSQHGKTRVGTSQECPGAHHTGLFWQVEAGATVEGGAFLWHTILGLPLSRITALGTGHRGPWVHQCTMAPLTQWLELGWVLARDAQGVQREKAGIGIT